MLYTNYNLKYVLKKFNNIFDNKKELTETFIIRKVKELLEFNYTVLLK